MLVNLADFNTRKTLPNRELGQLHQLTSGFAMSVLFDVLESLEDAQAMLSEVGD